MLNLYSSLFSKNPTVSFLAGTPVDSITMTDCDQMTFCNALSVNRSVIALKEEKIKGSESTKSCFSLVNSWSFPGVSKCHAMHMDNFTVWVTWLFLPLFNHTSHFCLTRDFRWRKDFMISYYEWIMLKVWVYVYSW